MAVSSTQAIIPVVGLGVYRHVAATTVSLFQSTPYTMAAIVDLKSSPEALTYTPHNLAVVLHSLIPRPQVFVTGAAISEEMTAESIRVWEEYVRFAEAEEEKQERGVKGRLVINLFKDPPVAGDWQGKIMGRLDEKFGKR